MVWAALAGHFHFSVTLPLFGDELPPPPPGPSVREKPRSLQARWPVRGAVFGKPAAGACTALPEAGSVGRARRPLSCSPQLFLPSLPALRFKWGSN